MPTLNAVRTKVDAWLADKWPTIVARQQNFFANRGHYWQGLRTHTFTPAHDSGADDGDTVADRLNASPDDQQYSTWLNAFPEWDGVPIPATVWIDTYSGPQGQGWVASVEVTYNGNTYRRSQNVGPESFRTQAWSLVPAPPPGF
jgi:hypothetical protein